MNTKAKRIIATIIGLIAVVGALGGVRAAQIFTMMNAGKSFTPPPETVSSTKVDAAEWEQSTQAIGTLVAIHATSLGAEIPGTVREVNFESGQSVKKGAILVKLDISTDEAQVDAATADAKLAKVNLERTRSLRKSNAGTQSDLDTAEARALQTEANVAALKATIAKKTIRAPFDGRIAIRQVELGQVVQQGTPIASLTSVDPIYAEFWLAQQTLAQLKIGDRTRMHTDIFPDASWDGKISIINSEVDSATRNVRVRATFPNNDGRLRPGMFVNVDVIAPTKNRILIIPATAVLFAPYGDSVFMIEEKKDEQGKLIAHQKFVRLGERRGDMVQVVEGLAEGNMLVSSGAFKLRNGMPVAIKNELAPKAEVAPKPVEN